MNSWVIVFLIFLLFIVGIIVHVVGRVISAVVNPIDNLLGKCKSSEDKTLKIGDKCDKNCQCQNDACARPTAEDGATKVCCPSGKSALYAGNAYCLEMSDGSTCWSDAQCKGGICKGNAGGTKKGVCMSPQPINAKCDAGEECQNHKCGRPTATDGATKVCCPSGKSALYAGYYYCLDMPDGSTCWSDAQCKGGICQDNAGGTKKGVCMSPQPINAKCNANNECQNHECGRPTATDGATKVCCPSGKSGIYAGYNYCLDMSDGSTCWSDAQCQGGICQGNAGGTKKGVCMSPQPINAKCDANNECQNSICARTTAADGATKACCPSGKSGLYAGYYYCSDMPDGSTCWSDEQCKGKICQGNAGGIKKGICMSPQPINAKCDVNNECRNNACARATAADGATKVCCPSGKSALYAGNAYCLDMSDGSICWSDAQCKGGICQGNAGGTRKGVCMSPQPINAKCDANNECQNAACARLTAADGATKACCPSGKSGLYAGYYYCLDMPDGSVCWTDTQCKSKVCQGNAGGTKKGICVSPKPVNASCNDNSECQNNTCARPTAAKDATKVCCPSGKSGLYAGYYYCLDMPKGSTCWSDAQCNSKNCEGNMGGLKRGTCT